MKFHHSGGLIAKVNYVSAVQKISDSDCGEEISLWHKQD